MKNKLSFFLDLIFIAVAVFILSVVLFNYFIPYPFSITYSICVCLTILLIFYKKSKRKYSAVKLKRSEEKECLELMNDLTFYTKAQQNTLLEKALAKHELNFEKRQGNIYLKECKALIFCQFGVTPVGKKEIIKAFNLIKKDETAYIIGESFSKDVEDFALRFNGKIILANGNSFYKYLKEKDCLPKPKYSHLQTPKKKGSFKNLLLKQNSKKFFLFGGMFLIISYFSPFKLYYLLFGCAFLVHSILLRLFGTSTSLNRTNNE